MRTVQWPMPDFWHQMLKTAQPRADSTNKIVYVTRINKYTINKLGCLHEYITHNEHDTREGARY
jgi:hypothetical protein